MADNILSFQTKVDLGGLNSGLDQATSSVQEFSGNLEQAMAAATVAAQNLADAQSQLGTSLEGNANAAILIEYQQALDAANAAVQSLTVSEGVSAASGEKLALSKKQIANALAAQNLATNRAEQAQAEAARSAELLALQNDILSRSAVAAADSELLLGRSALEAAGQTDVAAAATGRLGVSGRQAATAGIGILEGRMMSGNRAAAAFAATTLGLAPILEAAFPVIGLIALGEVIAQIGTKFVKAYDDAQNAGHAIEEAWRGANESLILANDSLTINADKVENEIAKLEHKPQNGLQLALDEAKQSADQLSGSLQKDIDKANELLTKNQVGIFGQLLGKQGTGDVAKLIHDPKTNTGFNDQIEQTKNSYQDTIDDATERGASKENIADIKQAELAKLQTIYEQAEAKLKPILHQYQQDLDMFQESNGGRGKDTSGVVNLVRGYLAQIKEEQIAIGTSFRDDQDKEKLAPLQAAKGPSGPDPATSQLKVIEEQFTELQAKTQEIHARPLNPDEALAFWSPFLEQFKAGAEQYQALIEKASAYAPGSAMSKQLLTEAQKLSGANEAYKKVLGEITKEEGSAHKITFGELVKSDPAAAKQFAAGATEVEAAMKAMSAAEKAASAEDEKISKSSAELAKEFAKQEGALTHTGEAWEHYNAEVAKSEEIQASNAAALKKAQIAAEDDDTARKKTNADLEIAGINAQEYTRKLAALTQQLKELQAAAQFKVDPTTGAKVNTSPQNAAQTQGVQNQMSALTGQNDAALVAAAKKTADDIAKPYLTAFDTINQGFLKVQDDLIAGNTNIARDFVQMGVKIVQSMANAVEQMLAKQLTGFIKQEAQQKASQAVQLATQQTASAASLAQTSVGQLAQSNVIDTTNAANTIAVSAANATQTTAVVAAQSTQAAATVAATATQKLAQASTITGDAAVAAANVYASVSAIPLIGPILAPPAAAVAYGAVLAFEAFEQGGIVGGMAGMPVPIMAHAGERVLSAPQTQTFERMVNGSGAKTSGSTVNLHYNGSVNAYDRNGMRETLKGHASDILAIVRQGINTGALKA